MDGNVVEGRGTKRLLDNSIDIEDIGHKRHRKGQTTLPIVTCHTPPSSQRSQQRKKSWREVLGPPPSKGTTRVSE